MSGGICIFKENPKEQSGKIKLRRRQLWQKRIITISREFGSGGRFIGEEVAKKLGIAYYDKEMIGQIAEQAGLSSAYVRENAELSPKKGWFAYAFSGRDITGKSVEDMVYEAQRKVIMEIAEKKTA